MGILIFLLISYILLSISLYMLFPKAGEEATKGLIPGLNFVVWCKIIGRPSWYALLLLVPVLNFFIYWGMAVDMVRSFKRYTLMDSIIAVIYAPIIFFQLARNPKEEYDGPNVPKERAYRAELLAARKSGNKVKYQKLVNRNPYKKSVFREWFEAISFAVFAAAFIRMFFIEAYTIPTTSMEGSLLAGDYLFVSKAHYGIRTPMTVLQVPLLHNRIPKLNTESYLSEPSLPYFRLPALQKIKRNKPVVFNWPAGDEVYLTPSRSFSKDQIVRATGGKNMEQFEFIERPIDKTDFYIKRCVGLPGDKLEVRDRKIFIDGKEQKQPKKVQFGYKVEANIPLNTQRIRELNINPTDANGNIYYLNQDQIEGLKQMDPDISLTIQSPAPNSPDALFPHDPKNFPGWSWDNYGPIDIPKAGETVQISPENIALYKRVIDVYEDHDLEIKGNEIFIDGKKASSYTFKYDYFWMMGDNRHMSEDSRAWGFVPETHIVGKPLLVVFSSRFASMANGLRKDRFFKSVSKMD